MELTIATFNLKNDHIPWLPTHWNKRTGAIRQVFSQEQPDVVGTQELTRKTLSDMESFLPDYEWVGQGRVGGERGERGEYCAIFYKKERFSCLDQGTFWLARDEKIEGKRDWLAVLPRICTWALLEEKCSGERILLYNTHLDHVSFLARKRGIKLIAEHLKAKNGQVPCALTGDFNAVPGSGTIRMLEAMDTQHGLFSGDSFHVFLNAQNQRTYHGFRGKTVGKPVDYIFVSKEIQVIATEILSQKYEGCYPSDHFPIIMKIKIES